MTIVLISVTYISHITIGFPAISTSTFFLEAPWLSGLDDRLLILRVGVRVPVTARRCVLGKGTLLQFSSLHPGVNGYLTSVGGGYNGGRRGDGCRLPTPCPVKQWMHNSLPLRPPWLWGPFHLNLPHTLHQYLMICLTSVR